MRLVLMNPVLKAFDKEQNYAEIERLLRLYKGEYKPDDIILLPEHFTDDSDYDSYIKFLRALNAITACTIIGGSHHRVINGKRLNAGTILLPDGSELGTYTKIRPYFHELNHIAAGDTAGEFLLSGKRVLVLICADFWYSDLILRATVQPDLILVPSLSVSRKPSPEYSRALWQHLAVTRSYEFGAFVGISDWSERSSLPMYNPCGVGGFGDPAVTNPAHFFTPVSGKGISFFTPDFASLESFREDRTMRGFFWK